MPRYLIGFIRQRFPAPLQLVGLGLGLLCASCMSVFAEEVAISTEQAKLPPIMELAINEVAQAPPDETAITLLEHAETPELPATWPELHKKLDDLNHNQARKEVLLDAWLAEHPQDSSTEEATFYLARVQSWQKKYPEALQLYERLLAKSPQNADYLLGKAQVLVWAQKSEDALPLLDQAMEVSPNYEDVYRLKLRILKRMGRQADFDALKVQATERFPKTDWNRLQAQERLPTEFEAGYGYQNLTNNLDAWQNEYISVKQPFGKRAGVYSQAQRTDRFGKSDYSLQAGAYFPIPRSKWGVGIEGSGSPSNNVLPRWQLSEEIQRNLPGGFVAKARYTHTEYRTAITEMGIYTLEHYWKNWRTAYTLYQSYLHQGGTAFSHVGGLQYYYGEHSYVGLTGSLGRQLISTGGFRGVIATDVRSVSLSGLQMFHPRFGLTYQFILNQQGGLYTNRGVQLGLRAFL